MKSLDDDTTRKARLRRQLVDAFMAGDDDGWLEATRQLTRVLRSEGVAPRQRGGRKCLVADNREFWK